MPKFKNRENEQVKLPDGRTTWLSRSCAVVANVWYIGSDMKACVLMGKRGPRCPDEVGKWVLTCGYLDYDETLAEAALREIYEEAGLDIQDLLRKGTYRTIYDDFAEGQPYFVNSNPADGRQNVSLFFGIVLIGGEQPKLTNEHAEQGEVEELKWVPLEDLEKYDIGFGHKRRIKEFARKGFIQ